MATVAASKEDIAELVKAIRSLETTMKKGQSNNTDTSQSNMVEKRRTLNKRRDTSMGLLDTIDQGFPVVKVNKELIILIKDISYSFSC